MCLPLGCPLSCSQGLRLFSVMVIVPLLQICWVLFSTVSGLVYFKEYESFSALQSGMFVLGIFVSACLAARVGEDVFPSRCFPTEPLLSSLGDAGGAGGGVPHHAECEEATEAAA